MIQLYFQLRSFLDQIIDCKIIDLFPSDEEGVEFKSFMKKLDDLK